MAHRIILVLCWARAACVCTALTPGSALLSPEMLRLPEAGRLGPLPSPQMLPHLPLPLRKRTRLRLPVLRGVQVSVGTRRAAGGMGQELSCHLHPSCRSFCWQHRPTQQVRPLQQDNPQCAICMEAVEGRPSYDTLICPSCTSAQFHRHCIQVGGTASRPQQHHPQHHPTLPPWHRPQPWGNA